MSKHARLENTIQRRLSEILRQDVKDPRLSFVTVTAVKLTIDLTQLKVYVTVLTDDETEKENAVQALNHSKAFIRTTLAQRIDMRKSPALTFVYDRSLERGNEIEAGLKKLL